MPKTIANDFTITQDSTNGFSLIIRCQEWTIACEDDLTEADKELFERIEKLLNEHSTRLLRQ